MGGGLGMGGNSMGGNNMGGNMGGGNTGGGGMAGGEAMAMLVKELRTNPTMVQSLIANASLRQQRVPSVNKEVQRTFSQRADLFSGLYFSQQKS